MDKLVLDIAKDSGIDEEKLEARAKEISKQPNFSAGMIGALKIARDILRYEEKVEVAKTKFEEEQKKKEEEKKKKEEEQNKTIEMEIAI